jgi:hypothetical protein
MTRYILFAISIALGLTASLYYGWAVRPVRVDDSAPALLREDYRADYALMVAESFAADHIIERAVEHLEWLDEENPLRPVVSALEFAQDNGYSQQDLALLAALAQGLREYDPTLAATPTP